MKVASIALYGNAGWSGLGVGQLDAGLNVFHGPPASGKTAIADLVSHALCGRRFAPAAESTPPPEGELVIESGEHRFCLRRRRDPQSADRLTVAALDGANVDGNTVRDLVYGLSPTLLAKMYVLNFREPLRPETLLWGDFARDFRAAFGGSISQSANAGELQAVYARIRSLEWELATLTAALGYRRTRRRGRRLPRPAAEKANRTSSFLAQLTDGELVELRLRPRTRSAAIVNRAGESLPLVAMSPGQRDLVYLSISLALMSAAAERGVSLPLVLDEPFVRLDRRRASTLAAVLDDFGRRGHQLLAFTARQDVVDRFAEFGTATHDLVALAGRAPQPSLAVDTMVQAADEATRPTTRIVKKKRRRAG